MNLLMFYYSLNRCVDPFLARSVPNVLENSDANSDFPIRRPIYTRCDSHVITTSVTPTTPPYMRYSIKVSKAVCPPLKIISNGRKA